MDSESYKILAATEHTHWWYVGRRAYIDTLLKKLDLPPSARILEVGAGTGGNLAMLKAYGDVSAMELDQYAREHARATSGLNVMPGSLPDNVPFPNQQFDLICLFDVLEHIEHDLQSLERLKSLLHPHGKLLITVPAYQWMWSDHDVALHHFRRYSRSGLRGVISGAGLRVTMITNFNTALFPAALLARLYTVVTGRKGSPGLDVPTALINRVFKLVFRTERFAVRFGGFPYGLSLLAVVTR